MVTSQTSQPSYGQKLNLTTKLWSQVKPLNQVMVTRLTSQPSYGQKLNLSTKLWSHVKPLNHICFLLYFLIK